MTTRLTLAILILSAVLLGYVYPVFGNTVSTYKKIALAGCSQTREWVGDGTSHGYEDITGVNLFTSAGAFGGGSIEKWVEGSSYIEAFRRATDRTEDAILAQVCVHNSRPVTYADLERMINLLKAEVSGVPVYLQPLDVAPPGCSKAGYTTSVALINQAVSNGLALQGPQTLPLYSPNETRDGCHPNDTGAARTAEIVKAFFGGTTSLPPPDSSDTTSPPVMSEPTSQLEKVENVTNQTQKTGISPVAEGGDGSGTNTTSGRTKYIMVGLFILGIVGWFISQKKK